MRRFLSFVTGAMVAGATLAGCGELRDAVSPGRAAPAPARIAFSASVAAAPGDVIEIVSSYLRGDSAQTRVPIATQRTTLGAEARTAIPVGVELGACLADPAGVVEPDGAAAPRRCRVVLEVRLLIGDVLRDAVTLGPFVVGAGEVTTDDGSTTLVSRVVLRIANAQDVPLPRADTAALEVGATRQLNALVTDSALTTRLARPVTWRSTAPAVATVTDDGVVRGLAPGAASIIATTVGGAADTVDMTVAQPLVTLQLRLDGVNGGFGTVGIDGAVGCLLPSTQTTITCTVTRRIGSTVTLDAVPAVNTTFTGFGAPCPANANPCTVTVTGAGTIVATFTRRLIPVGIEVDGTGAGTVTPSTGSACTGTGGRVVCAPIDMLEGARVSFTATPGANSTFDGFAGACAGQASPCVVTVAPGTVVRASFTRATFPVTLQLSGGGNGTVTPSVGAPCTITSAQPLVSCTVNVLAGNSLTLTAAAGAQSIFNFYGGACPAQANPCTITPTGPTTVTANFGLQTFSLAVGPLAANTRNGTVRSTDGTINCRITGQTISGTCVSTRPVGTVVTLDAFPDTTLVVGAWGGACANEQSNRCTVTLNATTSVSVTFVAGVNVFVQNGGAGAGTTAVTVNGAARPGCVKTLADVNGRTCQYIVAPGADMVLTGLPATGSELVGIDGPCAPSPGPPNCRFTATGSTTVFFIYDVLGPAVGPAGAVVTDQRRAAVRVVPRP